MDLGGAATDDRRQLSPVDHALAEFVTGLDHLIKTVEDGGLDHFDDPELVEFMQAFEQTRNRMALVDHRLISDATVRGLPERLAQSSMTRVLMFGLRLSAGEASRRVHAAAALGMQTTILGEPMEPRRPVLAAAQRAGEVTTEQVHIINHALESVDRKGFDPADIARGEEMLTSHAASFAPKELAQLARRVVDAINPDGTMPQDELNADRRHFHLRPTRDGAYVGEFRLTGAVGAKLATILGPLARPRVESLPDSDHPENPDRSVTNRMLVDERTFGQRLHDAVEEVCDRVLAAGAVPAAGGTPASVIVTIGLEDLLARCGYGTTADGTLISTADVLELADQAEIIPAVLNRSGAVLDLGRTRRVASTQQTFALIARDGGCSFPGCDRVPDWCERHHIVGWIDGGLTNLANLTLLCRYHHHNFAQRGWACRLNQDQLPEWIPPRWVDPAQRPMINHRIRLAGVLRR